MRADLCYHEAEVQRLRDMVTCLQNKSDKVKAVSGRECSEMESPVSCGAEEV